MDFYHVNEPSIKILLNKKHQIDIKFYMCFKNPKKKKKSNLKVIFSIYIYIYIYFVCVGVVVISYKLVCSKILSNLESGYDPRSSI